MKAGDLINLLMSYDESDEVQIEIYETVSGQYIDTTAAIPIVGMALLRQHSALM